MVPIALGRTQKQMVRQWHISGNTVIYQGRQIYDPFDVESRGKLRHRPLSRFLHA